MAGLVIVQTAFLQLCVSEHFRRTKIHFLQSIYWHIVICYRGMRITNLGVLHTHVKPRTDLFPLFDECLMYKVAKR